jgi:hypothetical protein
MHRRKRRTDHRSAPIVLQSQRKEFLGFFSTRRFSSKKAADIKRGETHPHSRRKKALTRVEGGEKVY